MLKIFFITVLFNLLSCQHESRLPGYRFSNFDNTPISKLAKAVKDNDPDKIKMLVDSNTIDFKDPKYQHTLLILSIANNKDKAFVELLNNGANPNEICGTNGKVIPILTAIDFAEDCNLFYLKTLIRYGAKVNTEISYQENGYNKKIIPILNAVTKLSNNGSECIEITKLLTLNGADLNICIYNSPANHCAGIIEECIKSRCIENLRYFIIEKQLPVPDTIHVKGAINPETMKTYTMEEALNNDEYEYDDSQSIKEAKKDIIEYLKKKKN